MNDTPTPRGIVCPKCQSTRLLVTNTRRKPGLLLQYRRCEACQKRICTEVRVRNK